MVQLCVSGGLVVVEAVISGLLSGYDSPVQTSGAIAVGVIGAFPVAYRVAVQFFEGQASGV